MAKTDSRKRKESEDFRKEIETVKDTKVSERREALDRALKLVDKAKNVYDIDKTECFELCNDALKELKKHINTIPTSHTNVMKMYFDCEKEILTLKESLKPDIDSDEILPDIKNMALRSRIEAYLGNLKKGKVFHNTNDFEELKYVNLALEALYNFKIDSEDYRYTKDETVNLDEIYKSKFKQVKKLQDDLNKKLINEVKSSLKKINNKEYNNYEELDKSLEELKDLASKTKRIDDRELPTELRETYDKIQEDLTQELRETQKIITLKKIEIQKAFESRDISIDLIESAKAEERKLYYCPYCSEDGKEYILLDYPLYIKKLELGYQKRSSISHTIQNENRLNTGLYSLYCDNCKTHFEQIEIVNHEAIKKLIEKIKKLEEVVFKNA